MFSSGYIHFKNVYLKEIGVEYTVTVGAMRRDRAAPLTPLSLPCLSFLGCHPGARVAVLRL